MLMRRCLACTPLAAGCLGNKAVNEKVGTFSTNPRFWEGQGLEAESVTKSQSVHRAGPGFEGSINPQKEGVQRASGLVTPGTFRGCGTLGESRELYAPPHLVRSGFSTCRSLSYILL